MLSVTGFCCQERLIIDRVQQMTFGSFTLEPRRNKLINPRRSTLPGRLSYLYRHHHILIIDSICASPAHVMLHSSLAVRGDGSPYSNQQFHPIIKTHCIVLLFYKIESTLRCPINYRQSYRSGPPVTNCHLVSFYDDWDFCYAFRVFKHLLQCCLVRQGIEIDCGIAKGRPGRLTEGSSLLAEDFNNWFRHAITSDSVY